METKTTDILNKANGLSSRGMYEEGLVCFEKALEIDPNNIEALSGKALALYRLKNIQEAKSCLDKILILSPGYDYELLEKADDVYYQGDYEKAVQYYDQALWGWIHKERYQFEFLRFLNQSLAHFELGQYDQAIESFDRILNTFPEKELFKIANSDDYELGPQLDMALILKGLILIEAGRFEEAIKYSEWMIENKLTPGPFGLKGAALLGQGKYEDSLDCFDVALSKTPQSIGALILKGIVLYKTGKNQEAVEYLDRACLHESFETIKIIQSMNKFTNSQIHDSLSKVDGELKLDPNNATLVEIRRKLRLLLTDK
jgi:tetratricopeptide (TPR) repeat protein